MSALTAIMDELAAKLENVIGTTALGEDGFQITGRLNLEPTAPAIDIYPGDPFGDDTADGFGDPDDGLLVFTVRARVGTADTDGAQELLLALMDDEHEWSVRGTLMEDQGLSNLVASVNVSRPSGYVTFVDGGSGGVLLGCEWRATVMNWST